MKGSPNAANLDPQKPNPDLWKRYNVDA